MKTTHKIIFGLIALFFALQTKAQEIIEKKCNNPMLLEKIDATQKAHPEYNMYALNIPVENVEVLQLRTETSKTFYGADGQYRLQQTAGIFHYKNEKGAWISVQQNASTQANEYGIFNSNLPLHINLLSGASEMTLKKTGEKIQFGNNSTLEYISKEGRVIEKNTALFSNHS
ncbi:MAG: hypothetical protein JST67_00415, partial [Bacteroidetes bacterium]|nr:hypothetical protein [Bacteroidota bacterium]